MLSAFEGQLVAVAGEVLAGRLDLAVVASGGAPPPLAAGSGLVAIGVTGARPDPDRGFAPSDVLAPGSAPRQVRVVPLLVHVSATVTRRASAADDQALRTARARLLEDVTLVVHAFDDPTVRTGARLTATAPDPGFRVEELALDGVSVSTTPEADQQKATVTYVGRLLVWPPGQAEDVGTVAAVGPLLEALPISVVAEPASVRAGAPATVRIRGITGRRLVDPATGATEPVRIAVGVVSDLPPADRGTVTSGTPASLAGFRLVEVAGSETVVAYSAPGGPLGAVRREDVVVHLAVVGGGVGIRLGSVTLRLVAAP